MTWEALVGIGLTLGAVSAWGVTIHNSNVTKFEIYRAIAVTVAAAAWCIILGI
jgi:hypothetical protein